MSLAWPALLSGDELAAEDDVGEEDGEVIVWLWVPTLLLQQVSRDGYQVRPESIHCMIHLVTLAMDDPLSLLPFT
jgi:hypothetical protein